MLFRSRFLRNEVFELFDFLRLEPAPFARFEFPEEERPDPNADELDDRKADRTADFPDFALASFMHDDAEPGSVSLRPGDRNVRGRGFFAVFKNDAPLPGAELACIGAFRDENFIFLFFFEARMGQLIREISVSSR